MKVLKTTTALILGLIFLSTKSVAAQPAGTPALEELRAKARERMEREPATFTMEQIDHSANRLTDTLRKMKLLQ